VRQYLPLDHSKVEEIKVKSVSIKYAAGYPVSAIIDLTIHIKEDNGGGAWNVKSKKVMLEDSTLISSHVENFILEAKKYLNNERAQGEFFDGEEGEEKEEIKEAEK